VFRKLSLLLLLKILLTFGITTSPTYAFSKLTQDKQNVLYETGSLFFNGFTGNGIIEVYSIIGNKITSERVLDFRQYEYPVSLELGNMYIIRVIIDSKVKTFKIIAS
jgi:hypothetical protein